MQDALDSGTGKHAHKDYISALRLLVLPFFGDADLDKIDLKALPEFDVWRKKRNNKPFSQGRTPEALQINPLTLKRKSGAKEPYKRDILVYAISSPAKITFRLANGASVLEPDIVNETTNQ